MTDRFSPLARAGLFVLAFSFAVPLALAQLPQQDTTETLSSSDVSDEQVQQAAEIAVALQSAGREMQMQMRKEMKQKYGNPQEMDSTEKADMRRDLRSQQREMQKKQMKMMQQKANEVGMKPQMFQRIMQATQQDSTLQKRIQTAMKEQMQEQMGGQGPPGGGSNQ